MVYFQCLFIGDKIYLWIKVTYLNILSIKISYFAYVCTQNVYHIWVPTPKRSIVAFVWWTILDMMYLKSCPTNIHFIHSGPGEGLEFFFYLKSYYKVYINFVSQHLQNENRNHMLPLGLLPIHPSLSSLTNSEPLAPSLRIDMVLNSNIRVLPLGGGVHTCRWSELDAYLSIVNLTIFLNPRLFTFCK